MTPETGSHDHIRELSDDEIGRLVERLNSLREGAQAAADLVVCGQRTVEPLRKFLLEGKPSGIFQPRQRAVESLAELGAKDVLIEYLTSDEPIPDPVDRYGEEAVINTAARLLAEWRDKDIYEVLLRLLRRKALPGLIDAVASFRRDETLMEFIAALGDSISRTFAEEALRLSGEAAHRLLRHVALAPCPDGDYETPSSLRRRRAALRLLSELQLAPEDGRMLAPLADARDPELAARANRICLSVGDDQEQKCATRRLIGMLPDAPWYLQMEIERWLMEHSDITRAAIEEEIAARQLSADAGQSTDHVLHQLLSLKHKLR